ncbi:HBR409Cp [Eremothecium sinecaudum]|uniref:HBR409Cp n=1 Tax=Eremothecium sinecaudum TaxID=45286 RepID=A0A109UXI3_9SACH|nr:HBR409Cp [Eremothecium sinecaudum]AMD19310.1 HBR409Cp [Eremothecium sinecaudum]
MDVGRNPRKWLDEKFMDYWNEKIPVAHLIADVQSHCSDEKMLFHSMIESFGEALNKELDEKTNFEGRIAPRDYYAVSSHYLTRAHKVIVPLKLPNDLTTHIDTIFTCIRSWWYVNKVESLFEGFLERQWSFTVDEVSLREARYLEWPNGIPRVPSVPENSKKIEFIRTKVGLCETVLRSYGLSRSTGFLEGAQRALKFLTRVLYILLPSEVAGVITRGIVSNTIEDAQIWEKQLFGYISESSTGYCYHRLAVQSTMALEDMKSVFYTNYKSVCDSITSGKAQGYIPAFLSFSVEYATDCIDVFEFFSGYTVKNPAFIKILVSYAAANYDAETMTIKNGKTLNEFLSLSGCLVKFLDVFLESFLLKDIIMNDKLFNKLGSTSGSINGVEIQDPNSFFIGPWFNFGDRLSRFLADIRLSYLLNSSTSSSAITLRVFSKSMFPRLVAQKRQHLMRIPDYFHTEFEEHIKTIDPDQLAEKKLEMQPHLQRFVVQASFNESCFLNVDMWQAIILLELYAIKDRWEWEDMIRELKVTNISAFHTIIASFRKHRILLKKNTVYKLNGAFKPNSDADNELSPYLVSY